MARISALFALCIAVAVPALAQVTVSGEAVQDQTFDSPMQLEVALDPTSPVWTTRDLKHYVCDTSSIETLQVSRQKKSASDTEFEMVVKVAIFTEVGQDRLVNLTMGMRNDEIGLEFLRKGGKYETRLAQGPGSGWLEVFAIPKIDAEEKKVTEGSVKIRIDQDLLRRFLDGPNPRLLITMAVALDL